MISIRLSLLLFTLSWTAMSCVAFAAPANLVSNPGFESGITGWGSYSGGTAQAVATSPRSGTQVGRSTNRTTTNHGLRNSLLTSGAVSGKCYVVSSWVRTSSATAVTVNVSVQQTDDYGGKFYTVKSLQVANTWTPISGVFRFNVNGPLTVLNLFFNGPPSGVDLFVDDASFSAVDVDAIENLLTNPGFENGTTGWSGHGPATVASTVSLHSGVGAASVGSRTVAWHGIEQSVFGKTEDGRMYYGAGWVTTDSATAAAVKLTMEVIDSSGSRFFGIATGTASSSTWTWLSGYVTLPATTGLTNVKFFVEGPPSGVSMRVDDCYLAPVTGLRRAAAAYPALRLGSGGLAVSNFAENPQFRAAMSAHFHLSSPGNAAKFANTEPADGIWTFAEANAIIELGLAIGGSSRGHTFVWHSGLPSWVSSGTFTAPQLQTLLWDQIDTKGAYFRGRLPYWDVANETIDDSNGGLRSTLWYDAPGIGYAANGNQYIREAFIRARAADPDAVLICNDYSIEQDNTKSDGLYTMLSSMVTAGVPVQGVGFQSHFSTPPSGASVRTNFQRFQDLGLDLHVTELDFRLPVDANGFATTADLIGQGDDYFDFLGATLGYSRLKIFQTWGVYDGSSWIPSTFPGFGQALPLDFNLDRKPAYWGMWNALAGQCEKLSVLAISSGDTHAAVTDTKLSANAGRKLSANAANDFITMQAQVPFSGQWNVKLGGLKLVSGGRFQLAVAPPGSTTFTNVGAVQDTYASTTAAAVFDLGSVTFNSAADWQFRCTVTGKNGSATDFDLTLDYLRLTPISCTPTVTSLPNQTTALNSTVPSRLFLAEDDTAQGSLQVTATSSNAALLPTSAIILEGDSPFYTIAATPLTDQLGTTTIGITASDGTLSYTRSFTVTVTGTPLQTWRQQYFGTAANAGNAADTTDLDSDGVENLLEYATKMNPTASDRVPQSATKNGVNLEFIYTKNKSATDITYIVEWSDTLLNDWSTAGVSAPTILSDNGTTQQLKVTVPAGSGVARRFVRLKVTR
jgi:endo-1,4-beta-xylanase